MIWKVLLNDTSQQNGTINRLVFSKITYILLPFQLFRIGVFSPEGRSFLIAGINLQNVSEIMRVGDNLTKVPPQDLDKGSLFINIHPMELDGHKNKVKIGVYSKGELIETTTANFMGPKTFSRSYIPLSVSSPQSSLSKIATPQELPIGRFGVCILLSSAFAGFPLLSGLQG